MAPLLSDSVSDHGTVLMGLPLVESWQRHEGSCCRHLSAETRSELKCTKKHQLFKLLRKCSIHLYCQSGLNQFQRIHAQCWADSSKCSSKKWRREECFWGLISLWSQEFLGCIESKQLQLDKKKDKIMSKIHGRSSNLS